MLKVLILLVFIVVGGTSAVDGPLTKDFQTWLSKNGYEDQDFVRADIGPKGSYGGKTSAKEKVSKKPVIFIHGNSDTALDHGFMSSGWSNSIEYFEQQGYKSSELYVTTWGDGNAMNAEFRTHDCTTLGRMRKFVEAVLAYTNATKFDIISHSMGVTIGRKIVKGGKLVTNLETCDLGKSLAGKVDVFVGLAGANYGLCNCAGIEAIMAPTCNKKDGFWPGDSCGFNSICGFALSPCNATVYSSFLTDLNSNPTKEGKYVFSAWSATDDLISYGDKVWGNPTSYIPTSTGKKVYPSFTHMQTKEQTAQDQYDMIVHHTIA